MSQEVPQNDAFQLAHEKIVALKHNIQQIIQGQETVIEQVMN